MKGDTEEVEYKLNFTDINQCTRLNLAKERKNKTGLQRAVLIELTVGY
ncbi:hypothetical protein Xmau_02058 [Xenorhabdus mauleonii]|uniref:Transposase n=1 Tax=Xenorhabdus mauleonii TaxID=351675 RepID=A0A2G0P083_9GAMM|nr:hypothetical protein [Xenorhabdus mauleonii]PHM40297.1 hypothetical protein Xmau_02058 [Xenorhabdus mauleonii]